ncbi:MAG TPA: hypothetical protein VM487_07850 [Phycisphaerae bacterium]|nr:hypothetical protein [Phycisphaerae bacterium]
MNLIGQLLAVEYELALHLFSAPALAVFRLPAFVDFMQREVHAEVAVRSQQT